jgi:hypothetical protein
MLSKSDKSDIRKKTFLTNRATPLSPRLRRMPLSFIKNLEHFYRSFINISHKNKKTIIPDKNIQKKD